MDDLKMSIDKTYKMETNDWIPLIDAMAYLKHIPCCGDVATQLECIFIAAKEGKYYFIEMGYEGQDEKCWVIGNEFIPPDNEVRE
jgi:hypothetical protein